MIMLTRYSELATTMPHSLICLVRFRIRFEILRLRRLDSPVT